MKINNILPALSKTIGLLDPTSISADRKAVLQPLITYLQSGLQNKTPIRLNFICTHNSRRSHLSQIWAQTLAYYFDFDKVQCYSGGTEATAMYPMVGKTLEAQGFNLLTLSAPPNPVYAIKYCATAQPVLCFSKTYDHDFNPKKDFGAIMTCNSANEACPMVLGANARFAITYEDPKAFDNTPQQFEKYTERSLQIATELFYVFEQAKLS